MAIPNCPLAEHAVPITLLKHTLAWSLVCSSGLQDQRGSEECSNDHGDHAMTMQWAPEGTGFAEPTRTVHQYDVTTCLLEANVQLAHATPNQKASAVRKERKKKWWRLKLGSIYRCLPWF